MHELSEVFMCIVTFTESTENRRNKHGAQCKRFERGQSLIYHNLLKSPSIPGIMVQIPFKCIHTPPIGNPPH